jgi:DNA-binding CsgD family transcriptional regulator
MTYRADTLQRLIEPLYAAPGTQSGWLTFLRELCLRMGGSGVHFISVSGSARSDVSITTVESREALEDYQQHWTALDPWGQSARLHEASGPTVLLGEEIISHAALKRTGYYFDFARRYDLVRAAIGLVERGDDGVSVVSINRSERQPAFHGQDAALLSALIPHLRRGLQLHKRLLSADLRVTDLSGVVEAMPHAVMLVNALGRVTMINGAASRLVALRDGLTMDGGELRTADHAANEQLRTAIADACRTSAGEGIGSGGRLLLRRPSGRRSLVAVVSPLSRARTSVELRAAGSAGAMVIVTDPESGEAPSADLLRMLFHLTPSEAKLAQLLVRGVPLGEAAGQLGVAVETVRKKLQSIFEKTGTHRQAELVTLLLRTARC